MMNPFRHVLWSDLRGDLFGGLTAAVVALPLALAVGVLTGVGVAAGLYGAIFTGIIAAYFGGTATQITGPTLTTMAVVAAAYAAGGWQVLALATIICGLVQIGMGILKLGRFITLIPQPVISGFTNGMAVFIFSKQIAIFSGAPLIAIATMAIIWFWPRMSRAVPGSLIALIVTTTGVMLLGWEKAPYLFWQKATAIGMIPRGFPALYLPDVSISIWGQAISIGITLALIASMESLLSALIIDEMTENKHRLNQELIGQGIGNVVAAFFRGLIGNGAIVRSVVNTRSGGRTRWSGVIHGLVILVITLSLGALFERVPTATLAGILMMTAIGMVDWRSIKELNRLHPTDAAVMIVTAVLTFALPLTTAIGMGFLLSAILFAVRESRARGPATAIKLTLGVQKAQVDVVAVEAGITVITMDGPLFFGDASRIQSYLDGVKGALVADLSRVAVVDATGAMMLRKEIWKIKSEGWTVHVCGLQAGPRRTLAALGVLCELIEHEDVAAAVLACRYLRDSEGATA